MVVHVFCEKCKVVTTAAGNILACCGAAVDNEYIKNYTVRKETRFVLGNGKVIEREPVVPQKPRWRIRK